MAKILSIAQDKLEMEIQQDVLKHDCPSSGKHEVLFFPNLGEAESVLKETSFDLTICDLEWIPILVQKERKNPEEKSPLVVVIVENYPDTARMLLRPSGSFSYSNIAACLPIEGQRRAQVWEQLFAVLEKVKETGSPVTKESFQTALKSVPFPEPLPRNEHGGPTKCTNEGGLYILRP